MAAQGGAGGTFAKEVAEFLSLPDRALVSAKTAKKLARAILALSPNAGKGMRIYEGPHGMTFESTAAGGAAASLHNFQVTYAGAASTVANGQIGGITPTLAGGSTLDTLPAPVFTLTGTGTEYVYAKLTVTHTVVEGYVTTSVLDAVDIDAYATEQEDDLTGVYYKLIATVVDGVVVDPQPVRTSLSVTSDDHGAAPGDPGKADLSYPAS